MKLLLHFTTLQVTDDVLQITKAFLKAFNNLTDDKSLKFLQHVYLSVFSCSPVAQVSKSVISSFYCF